MHYLDNSATTPLCDEVKAQIVKCLDIFGNPSSLHRLGMEGLELIDSARASLSKALSCEAKEIYFTSCGTEANNTAIKGVAKAKRHQGRHIISSLSEHHSVINPLKALESEGYSVTFLEPNDRGEITADMVCSAMREDTVLVSVMAVNNEVGAVNNIKAIADVVHKNGALLHSDCVQALGKISIKNIGADLITISGHKVHAPKGVGALYINKNLKIPPLMLGGGQERDMRSGTEATLLISAFGVAVDALGNIEENYKRATELQEYALKCLKQIEGVEINSAQNNLPYIINFSLIGLPSEVMLHALEGNEVYVSSGSACAKKEKSHVLKAMKKSDSAINSAVRVSLSRYTTREDIDALIEGVQSASRLVRRKR